MAMNPLAALALVRAWQDMIAQREERRARRAREEAKRRERTTPEGPRKPQA